MTPRRDSRPPLDSQSNIAPRCGECLRMVPQIPTFQPRSIAERLHPCAGSRPPASLRADQIGRRSFGVVVRAGTQMSATDAAHPRFDSRAHGRFRFDANRAMLSKRNRQVASIYKWRRGFARAKSRSSSQPPASFRASRGEVSRALEWSPHPAPSALCSSSTDSREQSARSSCHNMPSRRKLSQAAL